MTKFNFFVAAPYDSKWATVRADRARQVSNLAAYLIGEKHTIYSPICMFHNTALAFKLPKKASFWMPQNIVGLESCQELLVFLIHGFEKSIGVRKEVEQARELGMPISLAWPNKKSALVSAIGEIYTRFYQRCVKEDDSFVHIGKECLSLSIKHMEENKWIHDRVVCETVGEEEQPCP